MTPRLHRLLSKAACGAALLLAVAGWPLVATAAEGPQAAASAPAAAEPADAPGTKYSAKGADTCLECHDDETASYSGKAIFRTPHGQRGNARAPFGPGGLQCEACHGPGARHAVKSSDKELTINSFKRNSFLSVGQRNQACLSCHEGQARTGWHAGAHDSGGVACADCHRMHQGPDAVLQKAREAEVCEACHQQQRADFHKASAHPVRQGRMACSDCHNPHGASGNTAMLQRPTVNQTCTACHADKRGPLLWEHAPVAEDCLSCHTPHGSVRPALLSKSPPLLCQQCHTTASHPAVARDGSALPGGSSGATSGASIFLLAGSCTNCHSQVHGSNHPAGAKLLR